MIAESHLEVCECCNEQRRVRPRDIDGWSLRLCFGCDKELRDEGTNNFIAHRHRGRTFQAWCDEFIDQVVEEQVWGIKPVKAVRVVVDTGPIPFEAIDIDATVLEFKKAITMRALEIGGNKQQAARLLGMNRTTLVERLKKWERDDA